MGVVQRAPQGILELLGMKGAGSLPDDFLKTIHPTLEVAQFFGNQQRQLLQSPATAIARGTIISAGITSAWSVLYGAAVQVAKTATLVSLGTSLFVSGPQATIQLASIYWNPIVGAADGNMRLSYVCPYPMLIAPGSNLFAAYDAGTDANATMTVSFSIGNLG